MGLKRPLLEAEILEAQDISRSAAEAARLLNVCYNTYKKYAELYGIHERGINKTGIGISKGFAANPSTAKYPIQDVMNGKHPNYPTWKLLKRLFLGGYKEQKCECCGFEERRITDNQTPLKLSFKDGDKLNRRYENLEILCYNCYFLQVGNLLGTKRLFKWKL